MYCLMDRFLCKYYRLRYNYQLRFKYDNNQSLVLLIKNIKNHYQKKYKKNNITDI